MESVDESSVEVIWEWRYEMGALLRSGLPSCRYRQNVRSWLLCRETHQWAQMSA